MFFYGSSLSYVEQEPFFSRDLFHRFDASSSTDQQASPENSIYLYDPVDIIVENSFCTVPSDSQDWCTQLEFSLNQVNTRGCNAISCWRLALFYEMHGHLNVLSDQQVSDGLHGQQLFPKSVSLFGCLARVLVSDEPRLLQHYLDLELTSLLLGTQIDSNWLKRLKCSNYDVHDFMHEIHGLSLEKFHGLSKIDSLSGQLTEANDLVSELKSELNFTSASLAAAHEELDYYYAKSKDSEKLLGDYSSALKKSMHIIAGLH